MRTTYAEIKFGLLDTTARTDGETTSNGQQYFAELIDLEDDIKTGTNNNICDVPGVLVGHTTIKNNQNKTGITTILPL